MSPLYDYRCPLGHVTEELRKRDDIDSPARCPVCDQPAQRTISAPHVGPDGMYSYAPNIGNPNDHERKNAEIARRKDTGEYR